MESTIQAERMSWANSKSERYEVAIDKPGEISRDIVNHRGVRPMERQESLNRGMA